MLALSKFVLNHYPYILHKNSQFVISDLSQYLRRMAMLKKSECASKSEVQDQKHVLIATQVPRIQRPCPFTRGLSPLGEKYYYWLVILLETQINKKSTQEGAAQALKGTAQAIEEGAAQTFKRDCTSTRKVHSKGVRTRCTQQAYSQGATQALEKGVAQAFKKRSQKVHSKGGTQKAYSQGALKGAAQALEKHCTSTRNRRCTSTQKRAFKRRCASTQKEHPATLVLQQWQLPIQV